MSQSPKIKRRHTSSYILGLFGIEIRYSREYSNYEQRHLLTIATVNEILAFPSAHSDFMGWNLAFRSCTHANLSFTYYFSVGFVAVILKSTCAHFHSYLYSPYVFFALVVLFTVDHSGLPISFPIPYVCSNQKLDAYARLSFFSASYL